MEKISDEQLKKECVFHSYGRFANIRNIINANRRDAKTFKVLDVGGRDNMLRKFLPLDDVFYLDPYVDSKDDNFIKGDGCAIPLEDESFDWVVSADVFEHIPKEKRITFLKENLRVAKQGIILVAPFYSEEVHQAEFNANENYKKLFNNQDHIWLKDHLENGLPKEEEIEDFLHSKRYTFQKIHNNWLFLWQLLIGTEFFIDSNQDEKIKKENQEFNLFYNESIFPFDNQEPSYRKIYFIKKNKELKGLSQKKQGAINDILLIELIKKRIDLVAEINNSHNFIFQQKDQAIQQKDSEIQQKDQAIQQKDSEIQQKDQAIQQKDSEIQQKDQAIQQKEAAIQQKDEIVRQRDSEIETIKSSKFWKARKLYLRIKYFRPKNILELSRRGIEVLRKDGIKKFFWSLYKYIFHGRGYFKPKLKSEKSKTDYEKWIEKNENWDENRIKSEIKNFKYKPKISIVTPVYNVDPKWLDKCIQSVRNQYYENWELCLHDDASTKKETVECLKKWEKMGDKRIRVSYGKENQHISWASNEALKLATGEFVALLDNDDELAPIALYENVKLINEHPGADFIYSDEDKIDKKEDRVEPFFKPDWSPDLFLSQMYTCHLGFYRKSIIDEIGGFRKGYEGSQDYDLVLRFIEKSKPEKILHISKILYHQRIFIEPVEIKNKMDDHKSESDKKALSDYLDRNNIKGEILKGDLPGIYRVKREIEKKELVSIVIPFRDKPEMLEKCIVSILKKTDYPNYEIILVDNQSRKNVTKAYIESLKNNSKISIIKFNKPFNFSAINNFAVKHSRGEYILFLNNDIEVMNKTWLSAMVEHAQRGEVGAVGAKLLYPNDTIQHAGVVMGFGVAGHIFKTVPADYAGYFGLAQTIRNYHAATGACLLTRKELFEDLGGLNEESLAVAYNDVDFCLRLREKGYLIVYTPYARLYHFESQSRGYDEQFKDTDVEEYSRFLGEKKYILQKWQKYIKQDEYFNRNLAKSEGKPMINTGKIL